RVIDGATRKALKTRDGHCRWPGCERPASWCDGHHLVHWAQGGGTDLENLVMLCRRHHRLVHEGGWQLVKSEDGIIPLAPTVSFGLPRGPD
ncbi:MAG TPA: HNH endonuclease signature motif containing protein, partial [Candidatus Dormibacteraeota bacterium]|nr:HNH endonuclease signature motif containing protein [Candidatus Dormibacteraeota bacterium]